MKTALSLALCALALALAAPAAAQMDLPRPSPFAKVSQHVGLTEITVDYSSPAVKGRTVWGGVVPYGKLWRMGANQATKITFSKDVVIDGKPVPVGTYALFAIPAKDAWTIIINKNPNQGGTFSYKPELDVLRLTAKPKTVPARERMTFIFANTTEDTTTLELEWGTVRVSFAIKADTEKQVAAVLKMVEEGMPFHMAARHLLEKKDYARALKLVDQALALSAGWFPLWTKAQILAGMGKKPDACVLVKQVADLGAKSQGPMYGFFSDDVKKAAGDWKCK
jgi:hypothetical protein